MSTKTGIIWYNKKDKAYLAKTVSGKLMRSKDINDASVILPAHVPVDHRQDFESIKVIITRTVKQVK